MTGRQTRRDDVAAEMDVVVVRGRVVLDLGRARRRLGLEPGLAREIGRALVRKAAACDIASPPAEGPEGEDGP